MFEALAQALELPEEVRAAAELVIATRAERWILRGNRGLYGTEQFPGHPRYVFGYTLDDAEWCTLHHLQRGAPLDDAQDDT